MGSSTYVLTAALTPSIVDVTLNLSYL